MTSLNGCQHVGAINKSVVEKAGPDILGTSTEFKKNGPFLIISAEALALETTTTTIAAVPSQYDYDQLQIQNQNEANTNDSSASAGARSYLKQVFIVKCTSCDKSVGVIIAGNFHSLHEKLYNKEKPDGWIQVESEEDQLVVFLLSQLIYREYEVPEEDELQVEYALPCGSDVIKILWIGGNAVGFYTLKPKGTFDFDSMESYSMTTLDTLFIRKSFRRKGYALDALHDIIQQYPNQNIGLSVPISLPMIKVLKKYLQLSPTDRMRLWEVTGCGSEGNCQIIWYLLNSRQR